MFKYIRIGFQPLSPYPIVHPGKGDIKPITTTTNENTPPPPTGGEVERGLIESLLSVVRVPARTAEDHMFANIFPSVVRSGGKVGAGFR